MKLRVLIVDDERLSRERMRQFLQAERGTEVIGECVSGTEAVNAIREKSPDLVFLDVKMPELDGFGVIEALKGTRGPAIIFVTAYDRFALRAFDIHAVDYLLKPFDRERFRTALQRARERLQRQAPNQDESELHRVQNTDGAAPDLSGCIAIRSGNRIKVARAAEIDWIRSSDNYAELHVGKTTHLVRMTITALAERFEKYRFVRIGRFVLVNLDRIKEIRPKSHGDFLIILHNGTRLAGSRNFRRNLVGLLGRYH